MFVFAFTERSIVTGSNVMRANLQLIRALYFPRASLPLAYVIVELQQMLVGMVVLVVIMLVSGEYPSWYWLLLIPVVLLQTLFNTGAALIVARLGGSLADVSELIPFFLRISRYFCGVMYLIITLPGRADPAGRSRSCRSTRSRSTSRWSGSRSWVPTGPTRRATSRTTRALPPVHTSRPAITSSRYQGADHADRPEQPPVEHRDPQGSTISNIPLQAYCHAIVTNNDLWIAAVGWGVVFFAVGIVFFWRAEHMYGRG